MERVRMGFFDRKFFLRDFLRVRIGVRMGYLIENFFVKFFRVHMERIRMGFFDRKFF